MLKMAAISQHIVWENKSENFKIVESLLSQLKEGTDLVVLPECFSTGFTMNTALCETEAESLSKGGSLNFLKEMGSKYNVALLASIPVRVGELSYNRAFFVLPDGSFYSYDKKHLFSIAEESKKFTPGTQEVIVEYKGFKINLNICYDIRFPVWSRNVSLKYDILINIANFPKSRIGVIEPLVKARAIENMSYVLFCNRDGNDSALEYIPSSVFADFKGNYNFAERFCYDCAGNKTQIINCECSKEKLVEFREKFPVWKDFDKFKIL